MSKISPKNNDNTITITNLINDRNIYNLNPPYQRGNVWSKEWKIDLLTTIFDNTPINNLTLVEKNAGDDSELEYLVLDGKQRLSSVLDFIDGNFTYPFIFDDNLIPFTYDKMIQISKDKNHKFYKKIHRNLSIFREYKFRAVTYGHISWDDQINLFEKINHSMALSPAEIFSSKYIYVKDFAKFLFNEHAKSLNDFIHTEPLISKKGKEERFRFKILAALMGMDLNNPKINIDALPPDGAPKRDFKAHMQTLDEKLKKYMIDTDDQYLFSDPERVTKMIKFFKWDKLIVNLSNMNKAFTLTHDMKKHYAYNKIYFSLFLADKMQDSCLTSNQLTSDKTKFVDALQKYQKWTSEESKRRSRAGSLDGKNTHIAYLQKIFIDSKIDMISKNKEFSSVEKAKIFRDANGKCEFPGCDEKEKENLQFDHVLAKSLSSTKIGGLLCKKHNRSKSDISPEEMEGFKKYFDSKINTIDIA